MGEYRERTTGEVKTQGEWRQEFSNISLPRVWKDATLDSLNLDPVLAGRQATTTTYQVSIRDGVEQDDNGNWVEKFIAVDMFISDGDGTKEEKETAYQAALDSKAAVSTRLERDSRLAETDWAGLSDVTMSAEMTTYRQALRDITTHENFPYLEESDWPTKPV